MAKAVRPSRTLAQEAVALSSNWFFVTVLVIFELGINTIRPT